MCPYCNGWGHSGNDCPTDAKIAHLRGGVREQNKLLQVIRKQLRDESGMSNVTGFSLLSATKPRAGAKRGRNEIRDMAWELNETMYGKNRNWK